MYDAMNFGCVPVTVSDDIVWAFSTQAGGPMRAPAFSIQFPQAVVQKSAAHVLAQVGGLASRLPSRSLFPVVGTVARVV